MELGLNLAWIALAALMFCAWLRFVARTGTRLRVRDERVQFVALAILVLILFPVISVTDDLQAVQNPAEADCCLRRIHVVSNTNSIFPPVTALPIPVFAEHSFGFMRLATPSYLSAPVIDHPGLTSVLNRPPPMA